AFDHAALAGVLSSLTASNAQGEYYLTDTVALLRDRGARAAVWCAEDARELLGINTPEQLAEAEQAWLAMRRGGRAGAPAARGVSGRRESERATRRPRERSERNSTSRLWAPWRARWLAEGGRSRGCLFCRVAGARADERDLVLARRPHALLMLNRYPYTSGH